MTTWLNTAEGTNGANVAVADSVAGSAPWNTVSVVAGQTITYDNTFAAHGATSHKHANTTGGGAYVAWTSATIGALGTAYVRAYVMFPTLPSAVVRLGSFMDATTGVRAALRTDATNHLVIATGAGTAMVTTANALQAGVWYRIEAKVVGAATTGGSAEIRLYLMDATTPLETVTSASTFDTGGTIQAVRFGNSAGAQNVTFYMDDYGVSDTGYIGAVPFTGQTLHPATDVTGSGWTAVGGTGSLASAIDEPSPDSTDYVLSPGNPTASVFEVKLEPFVPATTKTSWFVDYRIRIDNASSSTVVVGLYQGATLIAQETRTNVPGSDTDYTMALTNTQAAQVTAGTDVRLRFTVTAA